MRMEKMMEAAQYGEVAFFHFFFGKIVKFENMVNIQWIQNSWFVKPHFAERMFPYHLFTQCSPAGTPFRSQRPIAEPFVPSSSQCIQNLPQKEDFFHAFHDLREDAHL